MVIQSQQQSQWSTCSEQLVMLLLLYGASD